MQPTDRVISSRIAKQVVPTNSAVRAAIDAANLLGESRGRGIAPVYSMRDLYIIAAAEGALKALRYDALASVVAELNLKFDAENPQEELDVAITVGSVCLSFNFAAIKERVDADFRRVARGDQK